MKKFLKIIGLVLLLTLVAAGAMLAYAATKPDDWSVERSAVIAAPQEKIFAQVNDLKAWDAWSPWKDLDPNATIKFSDNPVGVGASFSWSGNDDVGEGSVKIIDAKPPQELTYELTFVRPFPDTARAAFTFTPEGDKTNVRWRMYGTYQNIFHKAVCQIMNMDKMVGGMFEQGLTNMKRATEGK
jgi:uncharacterized protein YndB with AHSA1/START domain